MKGHLDHHNEDDGIDNKSDSHNPLLMGGGMPLSEESPDGNFRDSGQELYHNHNNQM